MDVKAEVRSLEDRLKKSGLGVQPLLDAAGVDRSTWGRWKSGTFSPRLSKWLSVTAEAERLLRERAA